MTMAKSRNMLFVVALKHTIFPNLFIKLDLFVCCPERHMDLEVALLFCFEVPLALTGDSPFTFRSAAETKH